MSELRAPAAKVMKQLALAIEICGASPSPAAVRVMGDKLAGYPESAVLKALDRCMSEVTGRLSLAAIIERIDDGRPSADEAWAIVGTDDEARTIVATEEAMQALAACRDLLGRDDVAARMAFKSRYTALVAEARAQAVPVRWFASLGHDLAGRTRPLVEAVQQGRLTASYVAGLLGVDERALPALAAGKAPPQLTGRVSRNPGPPADPAEVRQILADLRERLEMPK